MARLFFLIGALWVFTTPLNAQTPATASPVNIDPRNPREYRIGGISVTGNDNIDASVIISVSHLYVGQTVMVPGEKISNAINNLWKQRLFRDVKILATGAQGEAIYLEIQVQETPRIVGTTFKGISKSHENTLREKLNLIRGDAVSDATLQRAEKIINEFYVEKGFLTPTVVITQTPDSIRRNSISLEFDINRGQRTRIEAINVFGNEALSDRQVRRALKNTKQRGGLNILRSSKFILEKFEEDKINLIDKYNEIGKRDARVLRDSIYFVGENRINIDIWIEEGPTYYFNNITWVGNTVYTADQLNRVLGIKEGDIYNQKLFRRNLEMNQHGGDIYSMYTDNGYLFFQAQPTETRIENDSIDMEIRLYEGKQATIKRVIINGNDRTNDHVILRELRTRPGHLFSRSELIRSHRELAQLGFFNAENIGINPIPDPADGTVDIVFTLEETSSDQIELSGGFGGGRVIGTLGLSFNNFSTRNIFRSEAWRPLPTGDGQKLSVRAQSYGRGYVSYNLSFVEPWFGGKKPNTLSVSLYNTTHREPYAKTHPNYGYFSIIGANLGFAQRLRFPDDYSFLQHQIGYQNYNIYNSRMAFMVNQGQSNNLSYNLTFQRNSTDQPLFPRMGSEIVLSLQVTPPYSLFSKKDFSNPEMPSSEKYKWIEYHKWKFNTSWYSSLAGDLILSFRTRFGFLGHFNSALGTPPFERFYLGGDGMSGWEIDGREIISMRGYANYSLSPIASDGREIGAAIYNKFTAELRYPLVLSPMSTIFALAFVEGGNTYRNFREYNPFKIYRSAGVGLRLFLPMFGLLGIDYGYGFDAVPGRPNDSGGRFHFSIGKSID